MSKRGIGGRLAPAWIFAALMAGVAPAAQAAQDVIWTVSGLFDDGGTLSGQFTMNKFGFADSWDITTTAPAGSVFGTEYLNGIFNPPTLFSTANNSGDEISVGYNDTQTLVMDFSQSLTALSNHNALLVGTGAVNDPSLECLGSFSCPASGTIRHLVSGFAVGKPTTVTGATGGPTGSGSAAPEPAAWALMIAGFGLAGAMLRRRLHPIGASGQ